MKIQHNTLYGYGDSLWTKLLLTDAWTEVRRPFLYPPPPLRRLLEYVIKLNAFILFEGVFTTLPTSSMPWKPVTEVAVNLVANTSMLAGYLFHKHLLSCKIALNGA